MLSGGIPPETIVLAIRAVELSVQENTRASLPADSAAARRRAWDRERKKKQRCGIPPEIENGSLIGLSANEETINRSKEESKKEQNSTGIPPEFHRTRKKKGPLPDGWQPPQRAYNLAVSLGLSVENIEPRFRDYLASSGKQYLDYDAGFCNFIRNTPKFNGGHSAKSGNVVDASAQLRDRIRAFNRTPELGLGESNADVRLLQKG